MRKLVIIFLGLVWLNSAIAKEPAKAKSSIHVETIMRSDKSWDGQPYQAYPNGAPELVVLKISIPSHTELPWHTHPMPNAGYILSGQLTVEKKSTGEKKLLTAGQALPEMVNELHRGFTENSPVELIVFYAGTKNMPLSQNE